ncbi:MAG: NAD-dependent epimerase/dehydratase family protein, partial [Salinibacterium sp.]|nr:NAD-dependent epimerase/dehydratase family protein [Salinibacterium sp.]
MPSDDDYCGTRVLVLGSSGFIGRWVVAELIRRGAEVHAAARDPETARHGLRPWRVEPLFHRFEARVRGGLESLVEETSPDLVFNLAGYGVDPRERDPHEARRVNVELVLRLAETLRKSPRPDSDWPGQRLVHVGSTAEYAAVQGDLSESGPCAPQGLYGETKLAGTLGLVAAARASGLAGLTARLFTVYGA